MPGTRTRDREANFKLRTARIEWALEAAQPAPDWQHQAAGFHAHSSTSRAEPDTQNEGCQ